MKCRDNECINFRCASICGIQPSPVFVYYQIFGWFYVEIGSKKNLLEVSDVITRQISKYLQCDIICVTLTDAQLFYVAFIIISWLPDYDIMTMIWWITRFAKQCNECLQVAGNRFLSQQQLSMMYKLQWYISSISSLN